MSGSDAFLGGGGIADGQCVACKSSLREATTPLCPALSLPDPPPKSADGKGAFSVAGFGGAEVPFLAVFRSLGRQTLRRGIALANSTALREAKSGSSSRS